MLGVWAEHISQRQRTVVTDGVGEDKFINKIR